MALTGETGSVLQVTKEEEDKHDGWTRRIPFCWLLWISSGPSGEFSQRGSLSWAQSKPWSSQSPCWSVSVAGYREPAWPLCKPVGNQWPCWPELNYGTGGRWPQLCNTEKGNNAGVLGFYWLSQEYSSIPQTNIPGTLVSNLTVYHSKHVVSCVRIPYIRLEW